MYKKFNYNEKKLIFDKYTTIFEILLKINP